MNSNIDPLNKCRRQYHSDVRQQGVGRFHSTEEAANKGVQAQQCAQSPAEFVEGRESTKGNAMRPSTTETQGSETVSRGLHGIREAARRDRKMRFTALLHHVTESLLFDSFEQLNRQAASGVDQVTWEAYRDNIDAKIADLHERVHSGRYRAQPSRRTYIPKANGQKRPLGIASLEDKVVQHALGTVLNQIYENDFKGFSYGFRPGRSPIPALDALYVGLTERRIQWVLDADIQGFFDTIDHDWMIRFLEHRIGDRRVLRLIRKWLRAGVSEEGQWSPTREGTPQGSVISPLLGNVFMHYVLDLWIDWWRKEKATGEVIIVRYADDFVIGFQSEKDARRCFEELKERLCSFGLTLHPDKTRLIEFGSMATVRRRRNGQGRPETFDFLGFTHICSLTRDGRFTIRRHTIAARLRAKIKSLKIAMKRNRHLPIPVQGAWLRSVLQGWLNYHAVPYNSKAISTFRTMIGHYWRKALRRRSQYARRTLNWERMGAIIKRWLPSAKILHPWPSQRFAVKYPR